MKFSLKPHLSVPQIRTRKLLRTPEVFRSLIALTRCISGTHHAIESGECAY
ncbi:MAG TPA: hypothetical protein VMB85_15310 [Bryobacteraceae bacterium]|nr:hypothetical protein [Bryobacteraceae bacterium]